jgi:hypothetical protein
MAIPIESVFSSSTSGKPIPVAATATPGTAIHAAGVSGFEKVWIYASNVTASDATLTLEWGGVADPGDHMVKSYRIPAFSQPLRITEGQIIKGSLIIRAFSSVASAINISGYVIAVR